MYEKLVLINPSIETRKFHIKLCDLSLKARIVIDKSRVGVVWKKNDNEIIIITKIINENGKQKRA